MVLDMSFDTVAHRPAGMHERGGAEGAMELPVDREGHSVSAGDLYLDVGRCAFRREGGAVAPPARARMSKAGRDSRAH